MEVFHLVNVAPNVTVTVSKFQCVNFLFSNSIAHFINLMDYKYNIINWLTS